MSKESFSPRLLLLAHGSRDPTWRAPFERLAEELTLTLRTTSVRLAYLEFHAPRLQHALEEASRDGVTHVRVLPLFTASGKHMREDVPGALEKARRAAPDIAFELLPPLGEDPRFYALMRTVALEAARHDFSTPETNAP